MGSASHGRRRRRKYRGGYSKAGNDSPKGEALASLSGDSGEGKGMVLSSLGGVIGAGFNAMAVASSGDFGGICEVGCSNVPIVFKRYEGGSVKEDFGLKSRLEIIDSEVWACSGFWRIEVHRGFERRLSLECIDSNRRECSSFDAMNLCIQNYERFRIARTAMFAPMSE